MLYTRFKMWHRSPMSEGSAMIMGTTFLPTEV